MTRSSLHICLSLGTKRRRSGYNGNATSSPTVLATATSALQGFTEMTTRKGSSGPVYSPLVPLPRLSLKACVESVATSRGEVNEVGILDECSHDVYEAKRLSRLWLPRPTPDKGT